MRLLFLTNSVSLRVIAVVVLACAAIALDSTASAAPPPDAPPGSVSTYQQNALHDGLGVGPLITPLVQAWSHDFVGDVSYPLVVNGRVFVAAANSNHSNGAQLYAFRELTGELLWGPVALAGSHSINGIAADGQNVYSINYNGLLRAFSQSTGLQVWQSQMPDQYSFTSPPTVVGGKVYFGGAGTGGTMYSVEAESGALAWATHLENGEHSSPAVTADGVYASYACEIAYRLRPSDGYIVWDHFTDCTGGGGRTPVVHNDRVYIRDNTDKVPVILRTSDGSEIGSYSSLNAPAFHGGKAFYTPELGIMQNPPVALEAVDLATNSTLWTQVGDGALVTAPVVADGKVAMGSSTGIVSLFDEGSGSLVWSADTGSPFVRPAESVAVMLSGMAAADNMLFVSASTKLVAYRGQPDPNAPVGGEVEFSVATASSNLPIFPAAAVVVVAGVAVLAGVRVARARRPR